MRFGQRGFGEILSPLRSDWSLRWLDVCICAAEKGFAFVIREGCRELDSEVGRVSERTRFKRSSRANRARSRARRSIAPEVGLECSGSDENEVSLALKKSCAGLTAYGAFAMKTSIVLETRSILHAVRYAERCHPPGRLPILSDNLAPVLLVCKAAVLCQGSSTIGKSDYT